ncbi:MAG: regulatory protein RecX [Candidatus Kapaibacterium sp.]
MNTRNSSMPRHSRSPKRTGTVTQLVASKRRPERVNVFVDGEFAVQVHIDIISKHRVCKGMVLSEETADALLSDKRRQRVRQLAFAYVSFKPRTEKQVRDRLARKEFTEEEIDEAMEFCEEFGLIDDVSFARMYVRDALTLRSLSPSRLRSDLVRKGVAREVAEEAVRAGFGEEDVSRIALDAAIRKQRAVAYRTPEKQRAAVVSFLQRRGFSWTVIRSVMSAVFSEDTNGSHDDAY